MEPLWEKRDSEHVEEEELPLDLPPMEETKVREIEKILDYHFINQRLLEEAVTHASFYLPSRKPGPWYDRLEFIGDSVLNFLITTKLLLSYVDLNPSQLTLLRVANVDTERLSRIAVSNALHPYLRHKNGQFEELIQEFIKGMDEYPFHSNGLLHAPKPLADIVESVIGAIYMDSNCSLEIVWMVLRRLAEPFISLNNLGKHPVSDLHEVCQKNVTKVNYDMSKWEENATVKYCVD